MRVRTSQQFDWSSKDLHLWEAGGAESAEALSAWVDARLKAHNDAIAALLEPVEGGKRTPANTLAHYDCAIAELQLAGAQAGILNSVAPLKEVRDRAQVEAEKVSAAGSALSLNQAVYRALSEIDLDGATAATKHYVERTLLGYRLAGVDRDYETRAKLNQLHTQATRIALEFGRNIQEGAKTIEVNDAAELVGLPEDFIARHKPNEHGKILLTTDQPDKTPVMTFAESDALRERMFIAYNTRCFPVNAELLRQLLATRQEIAQTLGFKSWAELATADQMIGSAEKVRKFIDKLDEASRSGAEREAEMIRAFAESRGATEPISITSREFWYEQYRRQAYDFDSQSVRPYFAYPQVEKGVLSTASQLFKIEFKRSDALSWHSAVVVYDLFNQGELKGRFHLDMHPREGKDKWFSAGSLVSGVAGGPIPEAVLICNFPGGDPGDPGLLQYSDVVTYLHEFGHLMHALLGGQTEWIGLSGFATEGDFIEVPSQMLEEFFRDPALLQSFAHHYQTGEPIPYALIDRMKRAEAFGRADRMRTQIYYTALSLELHDRAPHTIDFDEINHTLYQRYQPWTWLDGNRMYASFGHLTGYSSNYYTYAYDKVIALDFFAQFDTANLLGGEAGGRYKQQVLCQGGSKPGREMVRDFLGRDEDFAAFTDWLMEEFA